MKGSFVLLGVLLLALLISVCGAASEDQISSSSEENQTNSFGEDDNAYSLSDQIFFLFHPTPAPLQKVETNETRNISEYCRYSEGTVLAWNLSEQKGEGEYRGEVIGRVVGYDDSISNMIPPFDASPAYIIFLHPYYQREHFVLPQDGGLGDGTVLAFFPCSILDAQTRVWDEEVDWDLHLIVDGYGVVIGKSNETGLFRLLEGVMVEGDPTIPVFTPPPDPLAFDNTLLPWMLVKYDDETDDNIISIKIEQVRTLQKFLLQNETETWEELPENGSTFLLVYLKVMNYGHKNFSSDFTATTPKDTSYRVFYAGYNYSPLSLEGIIQSGTYRWHEYQQMTLDRYNYTWGGLVFEVPETINLSCTYFQVDLGKEGKRMWTLDRI